MSTRLLVVVDDAEEIRLLKSALAAPEFLLRFEPSAPQSLQCADSWRPRLALLDLVCAAVPWCALVKRLRAIPVPVFLIYGLDRQREMLETLDAGAVSALERPFSCAELLVRVRAIARHLPVQLPPNPLTRFGPLVLDIEGRQAHVRGRPVPLTPREFDILELLVESAGRVLTRRHMLEAVWGYDCATDARNVDQQISRLRRKLGREVSSAICVVSGQGYCFRPQVVGRRK